MMMITVRVVLLMVALAGCVGLCPSSRGDDVPLPSQKPALGEWGLRPIYMMDGNESFPKGWVMYTNWEIESMPGWDIAWCDVGRANVTMEDSKGCKVAGVSCRYDDKEATVSVETGKSLPCANAGWVQIKGEIPFAVARKDAVAGPVTVKPVTDAAVPVVLKRAGLVGEDGKAVDVKATLKVVRYGDSTRKGRKQLHLGLTAEGPVGVRDLELNWSNDHTVVSTRLWTRQGVDCWEQVWEMDAVPNGDVQVTVRYMEEPRPVAAVMNSRAALCGFCDGDEGLVRARETVAGSAGAAVSDVMPAMEAAGAGKGKTSVRAGLMGFHIGKKRPGMNAALPGEPVRMFFSVGLETDLPAGFGADEAAGQQSLGVTDSTGRILKPAVFDPGGLNQREGKSVSCTSIHGEGMELPAPGAEWVRLQGTLRVPVAQVKESPVYGLPLVKGAERHMPVPGMEANADGGDVATAGDAPVCKLSLIGVARDGDEMRVGVSLSVEGVPFDLAGFALVDGEGKALPCVDLDAGYSSMPERREWRHWLFIRKEGGLQQLRIKVKYKADAEMVTVPVDLKVGLGGPLPRQVAGGRKAVVGKCSGTGS